MYILYIKVKVKFSLEQATKAQRESRGSALLFLFLNLGARWGGWSTPPLGRFTPGERDPVPIV
jgi:hypothetical protein